MSTVSTRLLILLVLCTRSASGLVHPPLLRAKPSSTLHAETHLDLALSLVTSGHKIDLGGPRNPLFSWPDSELDELQWKPLIDSARKQREQWAAAAAAHATAAAPAEALLAALEYAHCNALPCDGQLWLLPDAVSLPRSAPHGASLEVCPESGDLLLLDREGDGQSLSSGWRSNDELMLHEGWAAEELTSEAFELPTAALAQAAAATRGDADVYLAPERAEVLQRLRHYDYLEEQGRAGPIFSGGYCSDSLGRYLQALSLTADELAPGAAPAEIEACALSIGEGVCLSVGHE